MKDAPVIPVISIDQFPDIGHLSRFGGLTRLGQAMQIIVLFLSYIIKYNNYA